MCALPPGLSHLLDRIPGTAERWGITQIQIVHVIDPEILVQRGGNNIDTLGDFAAPLPQDLRAEHSLGLSISCKPQMHLAGAGIIDLVIPRRELR